MYKILKKVLLYMLCICISLSMICVKNAIFAIEYSDNEEDLRTYNSENSIIINEDISKREEGSKTFIMSDKSMQKILYSVPVHYYEDGIWKEIDNTLVESVIEVQKEEIQFDSEVQSDDLEDSNETILEDTSDEILEESTDETLQETEEISEINKIESIEGYETKNSKFKVKFSKKTHKNNIASISLDDYKISWGVNDFDNKSSAVITTKNNETEDERLQVFNKIYQNVLYEDVFDDVSLEYVFDSNMIKENIILDKKSDVNTFTFNYMTKNLVLSLEENGSIVAKDASTNEVVFNMPKPFMVDANNEYCYDVSYVIEKAKNNHYVIRVEANKEWLNAENRAYPVVIDPVISTNQNINDIDTTFITSAQPTYNHCNKLELLVGNESSEYGSCRILVKFDLPSLSRGDMVVDAQLNMALYNKGFYSSGTPNMEVDAHMATSYWHVEQVTWNTKPGYETTIQDYDFVKHADVNGSTNWKSWNITNAVKRWYEGESVNQGIVLKPRVETSDYANYGVKGAFWPERYNSTTQAYPYIAINYRNNKGIESYWDYTTASSNYGDMIAINNYSGNPVITHEDASTHSQILPVTLSHVYNGYQAGNNVKHVGPYVGKGWRLSIQQTLKSSSEYGLSGTSLTNYPYVYTDEDGTEHYFMQTNKGLVDEDGIGLKLIVNESSYVITDKAKNTLTFNTNGNLIEVKNEQGNKITIEYSGTTITRIIDMDNQTLTLTTGADGYLSSVTDSAGRSTTFTYSNGLLTTIIDSYGKVTSYSYDGDSSIIQTAFPDTNAYSLQYTSLTNGKRVNKLQELNGKTFKIDRSEYNITTVTTGGVDNIIDTHDDMKTKLVFDNYGRLISRYSYTNDKQLGAENFSLSGGSSSSSKTEQLNKLVYAGNMNPSVNNLLLNHNLESTSYWEHSSSVGSATYTFTNTNEEKLFGHKSFKLNVTSIGTKGRARFYQDISNAYIKPNTTYTASAYIKTDGIISQTSSYEGAGAALIVYISAPSLPIDTDPEAADYVSDYIKGTTDEEINNGWRRVSVTFTTPSDVVSVRLNGVVRNATGTAYFDGIQLEEGKVDNAYNIVENGSFEKVSSSSPMLWDRTQVTASDIVTSTVHQNATYSFMFTGNVNSQKYIKQTIPVNGKETDTYIISLWSYGKGTLENEIKLDVAISYSDGSIKNKNIIICNNNIIGWQYLSNSFDLSDNTASMKTPVSVQIILKSNNQANNIYFDGVQMIRRDTQVNTYDDNGNLISDGENKYIYTNDKITSITDAIDTKYSYSYDSVGNMIKSENNVNAIITEYKYDEYGRPISTIISNSNTDQYIKTEEIYSENQDTYTNSHLNELGVTYSETYNKYTGKIISEINSMLKEYKYNNKGLLYQISAISKDSDDTSIDYNYTYDEYNRLKTISNADTLYTYNYDSFGNVINIKVGNTTLITYEYISNNGLVSSITLGNGSKYAYEYDECGNVIKTYKTNYYNPSQMIVIFEYKYDSDGLLIEEIDCQRGRVARYRYDFSAKLLSTNYYNYINPEYKFGLSDNWIEGIEYNYDVKGNLIKESINREDKNFLHEYIYSNDGKLLTYTIDSQKDISFAYDELNRLSSKTINTENPIITTYTYKDSETYENATSGFIKDETIGDIKYTYDIESEDLIKSITKSTLGKSTTTDYEYDLMSRLVRENSQELDKSIIYEYSPSGDILSIKEYAYSTETMNLNNNNLGETLNTVSFAYEDTEWGNLLTNYNGQTITYDSIGNPLTYKNFTLTWDLKQLLAINSSGRGIMYYYDINNLRTGKSISNLLTNEMEYVSFFNMGNKIVKEIGSTYGTLYYTYDNYGQLAKITHTDLNYITTDYYVVVNGSEDVDSIYSSNGELLARYSYDTWGNIISIKDKNGNIITDQNHIAHINPFRYKGYYYDKETGLYYLKTRYYDPQTHRFINADDTTILSKDISSFDDKNLFTYCDNNPISRKDSQGDYWLYTTIRIAASITTSVCTDLIMAELSGELNKYGLEDFTASVLSGAVNGVLGNRLLTTLANGAINYYLAKSEKMNDSDAAMMGIISSVGSFLGTGNIGNYIGDIYDDAVLDVIIPSLLDIPTAIVTARSSKSYSDYAEKKHNSKKTSTSSTTATKSSTKNINKVVVGKFGMLR